MSSLEDIKDQLRSDKVTARKKARAECESRLFGDRLALAGNNALTMGFMQSAIEYELAEINLAQSKGKPIDHNVSSFYRSLIKYCVTYGLVKSHAAGSVFEHSLDVLCNEDMPTPYINNHKSALVNILQPNVVHGLSFERALKSLIILLKEVMVNSGMKDALNHKLLKAVCMCMFREDSSQASFLSGVIGWFVKLLQQSSEDPQLHALLAATIAECCTHFLQYQSVSLFQGVSRDLEAIFQVVVRYMSSYQHREQHKDAYLHYLDRYLEVCVQYHDLARTSPLDSPALCSTIAQLCEYLFSDAHLRSIIVSMRSHPAAVAAGKDPQAVALSELLSPDAGNKWMPVLTVMARLVACCGLGAPSEGVSLTNVSEEGDSAGRKTPRPPSDSDHAPKRQRNLSGGANAVPGTTSVHTASPSLSLAQWNLFHKLASISLDPAGATHNVATGGTAGGRFSGGGAVSTTAAGAAVSRQTTAYILESLVALTVVTAAGGDDGRWILPSRQGAASRSGPSEVLTALGDWVKLLVAKLEHVLQHSPDSQLVGAILLLLTELARTSLQLLDRAAKANKGVERLLHLWLNVLDFLQGSTKLATLYPATPSLRKDSVLACVVQLAQRVLALAIRDVTSQSQLQGRLWTWSFVAHTVGIECPSGFTYLAASLASSRGEVPSDVYGRVLALAHSSGYADLGAAMPILDAARVSPLTIGTFSTTGNSSVQPSSSGYAALTIAMWLMAQLSPPLPSSDGPTPQPGAAAVAASASSLTRIPVSQLMGYAAAFDALICGASDRHFSTEGQSLQSVPNIKQSLLHWLQDTVRPLAGSTVSGPRHCADNDLGAPTLEPAQLEVLLAVLDVVKRHLVAAVTTHGVKSDAFEQITAWQTVAALTLSAYASIAAAAHVRVERVVSTAFVATPWSTLRASALASCLMLVKAVVIFTERRLAALKLSQAAEFFAVLTSSLVRLQPALRSVLHEVGGSAEAVEAQAQIVRLRAASVNALLKAVRALNAVVLNKVTSASPHDGGPSRGAVRADVDDEFLDHSTQSATNRANLVDSDDDGAVSASMFAKKRNVLVFTHDQLLVFVELAKGAVALQECSSSVVPAAVMAEAALPGTAVHAEDTVGRVVEALFTTETLGGSNKLTTDSETKLLLAQALVPCSPSGAATLHLLARTPWQLDWGALAYTKVLAALLELLQTLSFWSHNTDKIVDPFVESPLGQVAGYVFPEEGDALERCLLVQWQCRYLQLLCIGELIAHGDVTAVKSSISTIFLSAFADVNSVVRSAAARLLPSLLALFKNTHKVYDSLVTGTGIDLTGSVQSQSTGSGSGSQSRAAEGSAQPMEAVALAEGIAHMGGAAEDSGLIATALLDLCKLCCSGRKGALSSPGAAVDWTRLLFDLVARMAARLGYSTVHQLAGEYMRWLIHEWLLLSATDRDSSAAPSSSQLSGLSQGRSGASPASLSLADFPCFLFVIATDGSSDSSAVSEVQSRESQARQLADFLRAHGSVIVPVICQLESSRHRWRCILQYAAALGAGSTDRDVAAILKQNICALKALELTLACSGTLRERCGQDYDLKDLASDSPYTTCAGRAQSLAASVQAFVARSSNAAELSTYLASKATDLVSEAVVLQCAPLLDDTECSVDGSVSGVADLLTAVLLQASRLVGTATLTELFTQCNLLDVLSAIHMRLQQSQRGGTLTSALAFIQVLLANLPSPVTKTTLDAVLCILHTATLRFSQYMEDIVDTLSRLVVYAVERVLGQRDEAVTNTGDGAGVRSSEGVLRFIPQLFAECLLLHKWVAMRLSRCPASGASAALQVLLNTRKLDRHSAEDDGFVRGYSQASEGFGSQTRAAGDGTLTAGGIRSLQQAATVLHGLLVRILHHCNRADRRDLVVPVLPLPEQFLRDGLRQECEPYLTAVSTLSLVNRMTAFVEIVRNRIAGEQTPLFLIWLQLSVICDEAFTTGEGKVSRVCSWRSAVDVVSEFLSALVGLCWHCREREQDDECACAAQDALQSTTLRLLGHFGSPDLLSLNHTKFPARFGNAARDAVYKEETVRQFLLLRVYALLWSDVKQAHVARAALRGLACAGYFEVPPVVGFDGPLRAALEEVWSVCTHSVVALPADCSVDVPGSTGAASLWNAELWSTLGRVSYASWVRALVYRLVSECFVGTARPEDGTHSSALAVVKCVDPFLVALKPVCRVSFEFAEAAFPLVIAGMLRANRGSQDVVQALSGCIEMHLLSSRCAFKEAAQLGCNLLIFLLRQQIAAFTAARPAAGTPRAAASQAPWELPYGFGLRINYQTAAEAATRCQLVCSALLFAELSDEAPRHAPRITRAGQDVMVAPNRAILDGSDLQTTLLPIYEGIHDPDAIYGLDLCSTLELQALMYSHKGRWMEALTTYEGILQVQQKPSVRWDAETGIAAALSGLGAEHTLQKYLTGGAGLRRLDQARTLQDWNPSMHKNSSTTGAGQGEGWVVDGWHGNVMAALRDVQKADFPHALAQVRAETPQVLAQIFVRMNEETAVNVLPGFALAQQLTEICEVSDLLRLRVGAVLAPTASAAVATALVQRWQARLYPVQQQQGASKATGSAESPFAVRAALVRVLLNAGRIGALDAMNSVNSGGISARTANTAHAITPQAYKFWNEIAQLQPPPDALVTNKTQCYESTLLQVNLAYAECRLLWAKGLKDAAVSSVNSRVITKLKALLREMETSKRANVGTAPGSSAAQQREAAEYYAEQDAQTKSRNLLSDALCSCGEWVSKKRAATGTEILDEYLDPAVQFASGVAETKRAYSTLATFHARLYQNLKAKIHSAEWAQGARVLSDRKKEFEECRQLQEKLRREAQRSGSDTGADGVDLKTLYRHVVTLKKEIELDSKERDAVEQSVQRYLVAAVADYAKVLELSQEADVDSVFRLVQLWLSNCGNAQVNTLIEEVITTVPSYKFVPLSYQIFSRLGGSEDGVASSQSPKLLAEKLKEAPSNAGSAKAPGLNRTTTATSTVSSLDLSGDEGESGFQLALCRMVLKLASEHPHHILPQLFALAHEREFSHDGAAHVKHNLSLSRLETANMLVAQLKTNRRIHDLVAATQITLLAYIDLANASTLTLQKVGRTRDIKYKEVQPRGKRFDEVMKTVPVAPAVVTRTVPLSPTHDYSDAVTIQGFQPTFSITDNGISRPKIVGCFGSDGRKYVQLVKGGDDMRQDAVMQQVFANVNFTLSRDEETQKRNLAIRTYKIVPTTPQTGVLEFVQNTAAFGSLLCDRESGVHGNYYPQDWSHGQCREHLKDAVDNADKLRRYQQICESFRPAFRFFFVERFPDPVAWVAARLAYSRSVAANSIIGYILGIGDRHAHNILIDTVTAEVVHIDFGIVFDQGKGLGTPETVPFRLTRDVVDGMGVTACEGTFRRSCEEVLRVLRDHAPQIMTILEVVIHDPLYKWSLSPLQARMKQNTLPDYNADLAAAKAGKHPQVGSVAAAQGGNVGATVATKSGKFGKDAAERTLLRVLHKLQGQEDPSSGEALSVEGQVDMLINEARSPHNLSKLFPGWAPWL